MSAGCEVKVLDTGLLDPSELMELYFGELDVLILRGQVPLQELREVTAGGGGPRQKHLEAPLFNDNYTSMCPAGTPEAGFRPFNYLLVHPMEDRLRIEVMGGCRSWKTVEQMDKLEIEYR